MSTFSLRIVRALATMSVATVLAAGTNAVTVPTANAGFEDPGYQIPTVGECHNYGLATVAQPTDSSVVVPCANTHTAKVLATPMLPESMAWETATEDQLNLVMVKACLPAFRSILGRTEKLRQKSAYSMAWYVPTQTQKDLGAEWLRCDLILEGGYSLQPLKRDTAPILHAYPLPRSVTSCLVGGDKDIRKTVCSKTHRYRATGTYLIQRTYYPGNAILFQIAKRECPSRVTTPRFWFAWWMLRNEWKAGDRTITCYSHTSS